MGNKEKRFQLNAWIVQGISLIIIMGMALWTTRQTGILTQIGTENVYWERARFILGEGGATLYTGSSVCSLGYSLLLVPVCALVKSPYGAYKAAILLNGFLLCLTYLMSVKTARKLFSRENECFLSTACFFAVFTPALFASRTYTGPEAAVLFLTWISLYLLAAIWKAPRRFRRRLYWRLHLVLLAACMILIGFLQITSLGVILAVTALLAYYVKKDKIEENSFLLFMLAVLLGLAAGNIAERVFLYRFSADLDIVTVRSSLEVLLDALGELQETDYLYSLFNALTGKLYSLLIASFLFLCPALWFLCRKLFGRALKMSVTNAGAAGAKNCTKTEPAAAKDNTKTEPVAEQESTDAKPVIANGCKNVESTAAKDDLNDPIADAVDDAVVQQADAMDDIIVQWAGAIDDTAARQPDTKDEGTVRLADAESRWERKSSHSSDFLICAFVCIFLAQMLFMSLYDRTGSYDSSLLSLSGLEMVLSPMILLGIVCFRQSRDPEKEAAGYLLLLCICTFLAGNTFQRAGTESISGAYCGFFTLLRTDGALMKPTAAVYTAACLVLLAALLLFALLRVPFDKIVYSFRSDTPESASSRSEDLDEVPDAARNTSSWPGMRLVAVLRGFGVLLCVCLSLYMNMQAVSLTAGEESDGYLIQAAPAASLLSGTTVNLECLYFREDTSGDTSESTSEDALAVLQSLLPDIEIRSLEDDAEARERFYDGLDQESDNLIILTGSSESTLDTYEEKLDGYCIVYTTETWAIWAKKDSQAYAELEEGAAARIENVPFKSREEEEPETETETEAETEIAAETEIVTETENAAETENDTEAGTAAETGISTATEIITETEVAAESETTAKTEAAAETETAAITNTTVIYGGSMVLAPGTYQMTVCLHTDSDEEMSGTITISDGDGTLAAASYTQEVFDGNGDAALSIAFTGRDVMRKVSVTIYGTMPTVSTVDQVTCQKTSDLVTVALDTSDKLKKTTKKIESTDKLAGTKGTVAYIDKLADDSDELSLEVLENLLTGYEVNAVTVEELDTVDTDYLIGLTTSHSYYGAMDRYSIIRRDGTYTLLVRNDSELYEECREADMILSDGYEIDVSVFAAGSDDAFAITLERGDYNYHLRLAFNPELVTGKGDDTGAVIHVLSGEEEIASVEVSCEQMLERIDGITEVVIPLNLSAKTKEITCTVEMTDSISAVLTPLSIELASEMFQFGKEEDLTEFISLIENVEKGAAVYVARTSTARSNTHVLYTYLQELLPDYPISEITYSEAVDLAGDGLLLTYGFSANTLTMAGTYSILAHAGQYTLWAKSSGEYLQELTAAGAPVLSSGSKISPASAAAMAGIETGATESSDADMDTAAAADTDTTDDTAESTVAYLPKAQYQIYLKLTAQELELDDTVEVYLYRDSTESEIESEIEELADSGYTAQEAEELVSRRKQCGSISLGSYQLLETDSLLISVTTSKAAMENLTCEVYTWHGGSVEAEILWIEMVS
ncbi:MAG: hypothetical protein LUG93_14590 [Lachnospiraceae bacterium]|nr:hypothetical protein [Lachnospiraceae bacterium]